MNTNSLDTILAELYALDPSLSTREKELREILQRVIESKPNVPIDEQFISRLRSELLQKEIKQNPFSLFFSAMKQNRVLAMTGGFAVVALVVVTALVSSHSPKSTSLSLRDTSVANQESAIAYVGKSAFGSISFSSPGTSGQATGRGGGGGGSPTSAVAPLSMDSKMIAPPLFNYSFHYAGEKFDLSENSLPVYKRLKGSSFANQIGSLVGKGNDLIDLSHFGSVRAQSVYLLQNGGDNYAISLDFAEGRVSINPQYEKWYPNPCDKNGNCSTPTPLTEKDVPSDQKLIEIANNFLKQYGIPMGNYGTPVVDTQWQQYQPLDAAVRFVPDTISVVYPITIDGKDIFEMNGEVYGLRVNVDIRKMKAQGLYNLNVEKYEASQYELETDVNKIIAIAERGGTGGYWYGASEKDTKVNLGTPDKIWIPYYQYDSEKQTNTELYIPAMRFPISNVPSGGQSLFQRFIVVPLVKEVLKDFDTNTPRPVDPPILLKDSEVKTDAVKPETQGIRAPDEGEATDPNRRY